jgi:Spy/CpxP family protein refolding chaperone
MKQIFLSMAVMLLLSTNTQAQDNQGQRPEGRRMDNTEMVKRRTEGTVKQYGLNEEQAKQLLELNTKYADAFGGGMRGMRGPRPEGRQGGNGQRGERPQMTEEQRKQMEEARKQREESMKKYDEELQKILTPEQYKAYKEDQEKRMSQFRQRGGQRGSGPRGPRGPRQQNDQQ